MREHIYLQLRYSCCSDLGRAIAKGREIQVGKQQNRAARRAFLAISNTALANKYRVYRVFLGHRKLFSDHPVWKIIIFPNEGLNKQHDKNHKLSKDREY